jgi:photosystem II stability/assembly factor-like uncharacterized protein
VTTLEHRIRAATKATAEDIAPGSIPPLSLAKHGPRSLPGLARAAGRWPGWVRALVPLAAAAAVLAVIAAVLTATGGPAGRRTSDTSPGASHFPAAPSVPPGSFRPTGSAPVTSYLECVTASVCYTSATAGANSVVERTVNGGATWRPAAALPGHRHLADNDTWLSCPTAEACAGIAGPLQLAVTTDGGARWRIESLAGQPGTSGARLDQVSCATAESCVVHLRGARTGAFLITVNDGQAWTAGGQVPGSVPPGLWYLRCDPGGRCIGLALTGTRTDGGLSAVRSADDGRTWMTSWTRTPATGTVQVSCGDALHCVFVSNTGAMLATSDGGVTWQHRTIARTGPEFVTAVSCPAGPSCFVALAYPTGTSGPVHQHAVIEVTRDGGLSWSSLSLPTVAGSPLADVYPLSCPSRTGCVALADTTRQYSGNGAGPRVVISSLPQPRHTGR